MESNRGWIVYEHFFPNGKRYIGITSEQPERRWRKNGQGYYRQKIMANAIKKYGWDNIKHNILYENLSYEEACFKERELISFYRSNEHDYGYNCASGGESSTKYTDIQLQKIYLLWKNGCSDEDIANEFKTTPKTIMAIRNKRGWVGLHQWDNFQKTFLSFYYPTINNKILSEALCKSEKSILRMAERLGLRKEKVQTKPLCSFKESSGEIISIFQNKYEASEKLGITPESIAHRTQRVVKGVGLRYLTSEEEKKWAQALYADFCGIINDKERVGYGND